MDDQHEALAFLADHANGAAGGEAVERVDTHAGIVFVAGDRAYKLKRSVRFSYLDFSTVDRREAACRAELRLNRRTAPGLYLDVRAIVRRADGSVGFDGPGTVLDWTLVMRRFDQNLLFDRMAERGELDDALAEPLSAEIARFHGAAEVTPGRGGRAGLERVADGVERNLAAAHAALAPGRCAALARRWRAELERHGEVLDRRAAEGKVRHCHGDLHLRNICLWQRRPTLFDCLEFNEELACTDVLYDLAFLLMDLEHRSLRGFANRVLNEYVDRSDETGGFGALPLMLSLRAAIRAHTGVAAARAQSAPERKDAELDQARAYLELAESLLRRPAARLIAIGGLSGTGKSTLARALAPQLGGAPGARLLHTDALRKRLFGVAKTERLPVDAYAHRFSERVYRLQREAAAATLATGYSAIVDGVFGLAVERAAIAAAAAAAGAAFAGLWLEAPENVLRRRIAARRGDMSDATVDVLETQVQRDAGRIEWIRVPAGGPAHETLGAVRAVVGGSETSPPLRSNATDARVSSRRGKPRRDDSMTEISDDVIVDCASGEAASYLFDFFERQLDPEGAGAILRLSVGLGDASLTHEVVAKLTTPKGAPGYRVIGVTWTPKDGGPYPDFEGALSLNDLTANSSRLTLSGEYGPRGGIAGAAFDAVIGHRLAHASLRTLLTTLKTAIEEARTEAAAAAASYLPTYE